MAGNGPLLKQDGWDPLMTTVVPVVALSAHTFAFRIGLGCLPWLMLPELVPLHIQSWAVSLCNTYSYVALFAVLYGFIWGVDMIGFGKTFFVFSAVCSVGTLFNYFCVPETKCKSKEQIEHELAHGTAVPYESI